MHNTRLAESLLSLFTTEEHAATMAGDFTESSRGAVWFWSSVLRAGFSLLWKDVATNPGRMASFALNGTGVYMIMSFPFLVFLFAALVPAAILFNLLHLDNGRLVSLWFDLMIFSAAVPSPYLTGRWLARRAPGRELAPCVALSMLTVVLWSAAYSIWGTEVSLMNGLSGAMPTLLSLLTANVSLHAGAIWVRRHPSGLRWFEAFPATHLPERAGAAARGREKSLETWLFVSAFLMLMLLRALGWPTAAGTFYAVLLAIYSLFCFAYAATRRGSGTIHLLLVRLLFVCMGAVTAGTAWLAFR